VGAEEYQWGGTGKATACVECAEGEVYEGRCAQIVSSFPKDARCALVRTAKASGATGGGAG
jgi:hypothetical protein